MNGQMMSLEEKREYVDDYIKKHDPYKSNKLPKYDLRGYAEYLERNPCNLANMPTEVIESFLKK